MTPSTICFALWFRIRLRFDDFRTALACEQTHFHAIFTRKPPGHSDVYCTVAMANPWPGPPCFTLSTLLDLSLMHP